MMMMTMMGIRIPAFNKTLNLQLLFNPGAYLIVRIGIDSESILLTEIEGGREVSGAGSGTGTGTGSLTGIP